MTAIVEAKSVFKTYRGKVAALFTTLISALRATRSYPAEALRYY